MNSSPSKSGAILRPGRALRACIGIACTALLAACASYRGSGTIEGVDNGVMEADRFHAAAPFDEQARQAVLRERSLNDSHFEPGTARLTTRGRRVLAILAEDMSAAGGRLSVEGAGADQSLHAARIESVKSALAAAGIAPERVVVDDSGPGGQGGTSSEALRILDDARRDPLRLPAAGILSSGSGGSQ